MRTPTMTAALKRTERATRRAPTHPGELMCEDVLPALGMSVTTAAGRLGASRQTRHRVLSAKSPLTPELEWRVGKFCGNGPDLWMGMPDKYYA